MAVVGVAFAVEFVEGFYLVAAVSAFAYFGSCFVDVVGGDVDVDGR